MSHLIAPPTGGHGATKVCGVKNGSLLDQSFRISITLKGLHALLEMILGIAILEVNPLAMNRFLLSILNAELFENPGDFFATHLLLASRQFAAGRKHFVSFYLLSHGLVQIVVVVALFRNRLWAYPAMIFALSTFVFYQGYRFVLTHSLAMIVLSLFDIVVIVLTWHEYGKQRLHVAGNCADNNRPT